MGYSENMTQVADVKYFVQGLSYDLIRVPVVYVDCIPYSRGKSHFPNESPVGKTASSVATATCKQRHLAFHAIVQLRYCTENIVLASL